MKVNLISYRLELIRKSLPSIQERNLLIQLPDANFSEVNKGDHTDAMPIISAKGTLQQSTTPPTAPELYIPSLAPKSSGPRGKAQAPGLGSRGGAQVHLEGAGQAGDRGLQTIHLQGQGRGSCRGPLAAWLPVTKVPKRLTKPSKARECQT